MSFLVGGRQSTTYLSITNCVACNQGIGKRIIKEENKYTVVEVLNLMEGKMKAALKAEAAPGATVALVDIPRIGPRDVLVKVKAASICGTDMHIYDWDAWAQSRMTIPRIFGHEFAGEIVEVGREVTEHLSPAILSRRRPILPVDTAISAAPGRHMCARMYRSLV